MVSRSSCRVLSCGGPGSGGRFERCQKEERCMARPSKKAPFYGRFATESLHKLKNDWGHQKRYLEEQCQALLEHLDDAISATWAESPTRSLRQPFYPDE